MVILPKGFDKRKKGSPRSDKKRIMRHFGVSEEEAEERYEELKDKLPERGSGLNK